MGNGFQFFDIILLALVAGFLVLRLRSVLGRRTGHEPPPRPAARPADLDGRPDAGRDTSGPLRRLPSEPANDIGPAPGVSPVEAGLALIHRADPDFDPDRFVAGARAAFQMIVTAFAEGDKAALRPLLSSEVYRGFAAAIDQRETDGHTLETVLVAIKQAEIVEASMEGRDAIVTVRFVSEQTNATRDRDGNPIDGDANRIVTLTDLWTFRRDTAQRDPNWSLVATAVAE